MLAHQDRSVAFGGTDSHHHHPAYQGRPSRQLELNGLEQSKTRQCMKKTTKFLFSHIGLVGLVAIYAVAGGFLFQMLELRQDKFNCLENAADQLAEITQLKQTIVSYIQNNATPNGMLTANQIDNTTVAFAKLGLMLVNFRDFVLDTSSTYRSYGDDCSIVNKWTYPNSLLFAITVFTTLGYGNITPVTKEGQLCCICYGTIGIPIFFLCVANISGVLGEMFRFLYGKVICGPCLFIKRRRAKARKQKLEEESGISADRARPNGWKLENETRTALEKRSPNTFADDAEPDEEELQRNERIAVPLTVTMIIIGAYIWIGSMMFHNFEEWTLTQSGYFCFITLSTIGFGDFVPGQRRDDPSASAKLIVGAFYFLFGMAILAMCFDLMQEEIVAKFRWIGTKIGIVDERVEANDSGEKPSDAKDKNLSPIRESVASMDPPRMRMESTGDFPTHRKASPRNNVARIHPMEMNAGNEATLHQRIAMTKSN